MIGFVYEMLQNIVGKGENAGYQHFIVFIQYFQNAFSSRWLKVCAVKANDGTSHEIYRPQVEPQETYYSGHRNYHAIHTQIIVDTQRIIRYIRRKWIFRTPE